MLIQDFGGYQKLYPKADNNQILTEYSSSMNINCEKKFSKEKDPPGHYKKWSWKK